MCVCTLTQIFLFFWGGGWEYLVASQRPPRPARPNCQRQENALLLNFLLLLRKACFSFSPSYCLFCFQSAKPSISSSSSFSRFSSVLIFKFYISVYIFSVYIFPKSSKKPTAVLRRECEFFSEMISFSSKIVSKYV